MKAGFIAGFVMVSSVALAAQWIQQTTAGIPRTADGKAGDLGRNGSYMRHARRTASPISRGSGPSRR